jgi:hypothetical protein
VIRGRASAGGRCRHVEFGQRPEPGQLLGLHAGEAGATHHVDRAQHVDHGQVGHHDDERDPVAVAAGTGGQFVAQRLEEGAEALVGQFQVLGQAGLDQRVDLSVELELRLGRGGDER